MNIFKILFLYFGIISQGLAAQEAQPSRFHEILARPEPLRAYAQAFSSFVFSGQVEVISKPEKKSEEKEEGETPPKRYVSQWEIKWDENGNYHLSKTSLLKEKNLDLIYLDKHFFLRRNHETEFRQVPPQAEFFRWVDQPFLDIFSMIQRAGFSDSSLFQPENGLSCQTLNESKVCLDPGSQLPLKGQIQTLPTERKQLRLFFSLQPAPKGSLQIQLPEPDAEKTE